MRVLDILFPKFCISCKVVGSYLCSNCFARISFSLGDICLVCNRASFNGLTHPICKKRYTIDGAFASLTYVGTVKKLVYVFKFKPHVTDIQHLLIDFFYEGLIQKQACYQILASKPVLVPIPLSSAKLRLRGYNQALLLADGIGKRMGLHVYEILQRVKMTKTQVGLSKEQRQENIKNAFVLKNKKMILPKIILLVDDVYTSGATLVEAASVLKRAGVREVYGITLAHGQ